MSRLSPDDQAFLNASMEGFDVEAGHAISAFQDAAVGCIRDMEAQIVRNYPEFYSNEERHAAGVSPTWKDLRLWPRQSLDWWYWNARRLVAPKEPKS